MVRIIPYVAAANNQFTDNQITAITQEVQKAERYISDVFPEFGYEVDLVVSAPSQLMPIIKEDSISGRAYSSQFIQIVVEPEKINESSHVLFETLCHEMSHSIRWECTPEHADTFIKGAILEGLAVVLEESAVNDAKIKNYQYFLQELQSTPQDAILEIFQKLGDKINCKDYDYETLFYTGDSVLPRWAGYKIGYFIAKQYAKAHNLSIREVSLLPYDPFLSWVNDNIKTS